MKILEKKKDVIMSEIDQDTGLSNTDLSHMLREAKESPTVDFNLERIINLGKKMKKSH